MPSTAPFIPSINLSVLDNVITIGQPELFRFTHCINICPHVSQVATCDRISLPYCMTNLVSSCFPPTKAKCLLPAGGSHGLNCN